MKNEERLLFEGYLYGNEEDVQLAKEEKKKAMSILMKTQTGKDFSFEDRLVSIVTVVRIDVAQYTAKHRPLPENMR